MTNGNTPENFLLVFDWGNTLMKVLPQYQGPMADWPEVEPVAGASQALDALSGDHALVVATNAGDSRSAQVQTALQRVGLAQHFRAVFTANELGSAKPDLYFFRQLESVLARPPHQLVMIGDDYRADILGAKAAGWQAIWYNPMRQAAPALLPQQNAEVTHLNELPDILSRPLPPDYQTSLSWLLERNIPFNIIAHLQLAAAAAYLLAVWLRQKGVSVDPVQTHRGGLLHDLAKVDASSGKKTDHAAAARDLLLARGQPDLAEIADRHMLHQSKDSPRYPQTWEQKLVHFADKLSEGSHLVSLEERIMALKDRYPNHAAQIEESQPLLLELQDDICKVLGIAPSEMIDSLRETLRSSNATSPTGFG